MTGRWVFVCGPSGAGKDTVIEGARSLLARDGRILFATRVETRASAASPRHEAVSRCEFERRRAAGEFAWQWQAHGICYGIPAGFRAAIAGGMVVVVNGSREHAGGLPPEPGIARVLVTAPAEAIAQRLLARGREPPHQVRQRLARNGQLSGIMVPDAIVENAGSVHAAASALCGLLLDFAAQADAGSAR